MIGASTNRPTLVVGKTGTGKTTAALDILGPNPIIRYANEYDIVDNFSIPIDRGILIEEVNIKPNIEVIKNTLLEYKGAIVLTSCNQKDVPKKLYHLCKLYRSGTEKYLTNSIMKDAPNSEEPIEFTMNTFDLFYDFLKNKNREEVVTKLKINKPYDELFLTWLVTNMHPNKLAYIDGKVKRRWSQDYFFELLSYSHNGRVINIVNPEKSNYTKFSSICRKIGLRYSEQNLITQLLNNEDFRYYVSRKVNNSERRLLKIKEKPRESRPKKTKQKTLEEWF